MEVILIVIAGWVVLILAIIALFRSLSHRIKAPTDNLNKQILNLEKRIKELEEKKKDK